MIIHSDFRAVPLDNFDGFHCLITDPPYSAFVHENMASHGSNGRGSRPRDPGFTALTPRDRDVIAEIARRMSRWSVIFSDLESSAHWIGDVTRNGVAKTEYIRFVPWIRWSQPQLSGDRPPSGAEAVLHFSAPGRKHWNGPGSLTHYARRPLRGEGKHPTEKPLDLMLDIVSWFSDPGDRVLDVCAGMGTTALACRLLGRECVALELDERWIAPATARETGALSDRDRTRAEEWCESTHAEASARPAPKAADGSDVKTWERAQRRLADVARVAEWL